MKSYLALSILLSSFLQAGTYSDALFRSMQISDKCLAELRVVKKELAQVKAKDVKKKKKIRVFREPPINEHRKRLLVDSDALKKRYDVMCDKTLYDDGVYKIPTFMANIRETHQAKGKRVTHMQRGEMVYFDSVYARESGKELIVWIKTKEGWLYVYGQKRSETVVEAAKKSSAITIEYSSQNTGGGKQ